MARPFPTYRWWLVARRVLAPGSPSVILPCHVDAQEAGDDQRPDRIRAVQELALLDRRRDGADDLPDDLFRRAEGQHGLLDRDVRRVGEAGGAGADPARSLGLDADGDGGDPR